MKSRKITCIVCPIGCEIDVDYNPDEEEILNMEGNTCPKGKNYVKKEIFYPERVLTSSVRVIGGELPLVSIRTDKAIPKEKILPMMELIRDQVVEAPVEIYDIIVSNPLNLECCIIATKNVN